MKYQALFSQNPHEIIQQLEMIALHFEQKIFDDEIIALLSWLHNRWTKTTDDQAYFSSHIQSMAMQWRKPHTEDYTENGNLSIYEIIPSHIKKILYIHFSDEKLTQILQASEIFSLAYPNKIYIGNADTAGYDEDCVTYWAKFEPFKMYFEVLLGKYEQFDNEFITLAQVLWAHYRWAEDVKCEGIFCLEASAYFLRKASYLSPKISIYYFMPLAQTKKYSADYITLLQEEKTLLPTHRQSFTFFYYAQYLQHYTEEKEKSILFYQHFLDNEPNFLPINNFALFSADATQRMYAPSSQEAFTEIGRIFFEKNDFKKAIFYVKKAIEIRPNNYQTPHLLLAQIYKKQGNTRLFLAEMENQIDILTHWKVPHRNIVYVYEYDKNATQNYHLGISFTSYTRTKVYFLHQLIQEIAEIYLYEMLDTKKAKIFYKKLISLFKDQQYTNTLTYLKPYNERKKPFDHQKIIIDALENQIRMAFDQKDFWQVRSLCENLKKIQATNTFAFLYLEKLAQK